MIELYLCTNGGLFVYKKFNFYHWFNFVLFYFFKLKKVLKEYRCNFVKIFYYKEF